MDGISDLLAILSSLDPQISEENYVFLTVASMENTQLINDAWAIIKEREGISLILSEEQAKKWGLYTTPSFKRITLNVHSSLTSVGLTAAVSAKLASAGISANIVAGFFHDHIFIPVTVADKALELLKSLSE